MTEEEAVRRTLEANPEAAADLREKVEAGKLQFPDSIPDEQDLVIVAGPWPSKVIGTMQVRCEICLAFLAIQPQTQEMIANRTGKSRIRCFGCHHRSVAAPDPETKPS